jgi:hypothetical protein
MIELLLILLLIAGGWLAYNYHRRPEWVKRKLQAIKDKLRGDKHE